MPKYPVIVLEGPDAAGKTTLAKQLVQEWGFTYRHLTYRFKDRMHLYHWAAMEMCLLDAEKGPVVLDRWWPSELIYANIFRGGSKWPLWGRMLDRVALRYGFTYVWCNPSNTEAHEKRFVEMSNKGREMYPTVNRVREAYVDLFIKQGTRFDMVDYDIDTHGQNIADYTQFLWDISNHMIGDLPRFSTKNISRMFAGNLVDPKILLVGEKSNGKYRRDVWPFFEHGYSSLWLTNALEQVGIKESDIAWVNAYDEDNLPYYTLLENIYDVIVQQKQRAYVICLGQKASVALKEIGIQCDYIVKHPAWSRRFAPNNFSEWRRVKKLLGD